MKRLYFPSPYCYYYYLMNAPERNSCISFSFQLLRLSWIWLHALGVYRLQPICNKTNNENGPDVAFAELGFSLLSNVNTFQGEFYLEMHAAASWCQNLPFTRGDIH